MLKSKKNTECLRETENYTEVIEHLSTLHSELVRQFLFVEATKVRNHITKLIKSIESNNIWDIESLITELSSDFINDE
ncbi:MAG TPA: hypothetical protein VHP36_07595 [Chitinispirillaceae bacterium]|nr:hypothetical protein [Chitinispirillaceae bacterium]